MIKNLFTVFITFLSINSLISMQKTYPELKKIDCNQTIFARNKLKTVGYSSKEHYINLLKFILNTESNNEYLSNTVTNFIVANHIAFQDDHPFLNLDEICDIIKENLKNNQNIYKQNLTKYLISQLNIYCFEAKNINKLEELKNLQQE